MFIGSMHMAAPSRNFLQEPAPDQDADRPVIVDISIPDFSETVPDPDRFRRSHTDFEGLRLNGRACIIACQRYQT
jgi:hypothetical protein